MPHIDSFDLLILYALGFGEITLLISCLVQLAGIRQQLFDHARRINTLERGKS